MSPINFDILLADYPRFEAAWAALRKWFALNSRKEYVELTVLIRALPSVDQFDLVLAIHTMVEKGMLDIAYRVKAPGGYLLEGEFDEPDMIPALLPDRDFSGYVKTSEADIVSGYRWEPADAA